MHDWTAELREASEVLLPRAALRAAPLPPLEDELALLARARGLPTAPAEALVPVEGEGIDLLHSYARSGWRQAVDQQWLRLGTLERLHRAAAALPAGFGFSIFDAWRPMLLQQELFDAGGDASAPADAWTMVAPPSTDPATPPPHLTGGTVDLTLSWQGRAIALGTGFDDTSPAAELAAFEEVPGPVRALRRLLFHTLRDAGFVALREEWWHYEHGTRLWSAATRHPLLYGPTSPSRPRPSPS